MLQIPSIVILSFVSYSPSTLRCHWVLLLSNWRAIYFSSCTLWFRLNKISDREFHRRVDALLKGFPELELAVDASVYLWAQERPYLTEKPRNCGWFWRHNEVRRLGRHTSTKCWCLHNTITIFGAARPKMLYKTGKISSVLWDWKILMQSPDSQARLLKIKPTATSQRIVIQG